MTGALAATVTAAAAAEWLKVRRNLYVWLALLVILAVLAGRDYGLTWYLAHHAGGPEVLRALEPAGLPRMAAGNPSGITGALEFVVGGLIVGTEYTWGTLRTALTVGPGRLETFLAKAGVLALVMAAVTVLRYLVAAACSLVIAGLDHQAAAWPAAGAVALSLPAAWLIALCYGSFGACLAFLFRGATLAYGLGLTYLFVVEDRVFGVFGADGGPLLAQAWKLCPGPNAASLAASFGGGAGQLVGPGRAALTLVAYTAVALAVSAALVLRRDVT